MTKITKNYKNFTIHQYDELESTNKLAFELANNGQLQENEIILADSQTRGKGRLNRDWVSPKGNLSFSLILKPQINKSQTHHLSFIAICALRQTIEEISQNSDLKIENKWPNDLIINNKKLAGILLESKIGSSLEFCILGIGLNINSNPKNTIFPAGNLNDLNILAKKDEILEIFLNNFQKLYQNYQNFGFKTIRTLWLQKAYKLNQEITVNLGQERLTGIFRNLDNEGNLELEIDQKLQKITTADIS